MSQENFLDRLTDKIKNVKIIAYILLIVAIIISIDQLTGAFDNFVSRAKKWSDFFSNKTQIDTTSTSISDSINNKIKTYSLNIFSIPENAMIYVEGKFVGRTNKQIELSSGSHRIILRKFGCEDYSEVVEVPRQTVLSIILVRK